MGVPGHIVEELQEFSKRKDLNQFFWYPQDVFAMVRFEIAQLVESRRKQGEDRISVIYEGERTIIVVADGAGGIGNGDIAAEVVIKEVESDFHNCTSANGWETKLRQIDVRIGVGESTSVVVDLRPDEIVGASVGDSKAWIVHDGKIIDLTANQIRKPLLGTGNTQPTGFTFTSLVGVLIVATDGFYNYVKRDQLTAMIAQTEFIDLPRRCVEMVRLPSGELWDDIGIVCCRIPRPRRTRKRYVI